MSDYAAGETPQLNDKYTLGVPCSVILAQLERVQVARARLRAEEGPLPWVGIDRPDYYLRLHEIALKRALRLAGLSHDAYVVRYTLLIGAIWAACLAFLWIGEADVMYLPRHLLSGAGSIGALLALVLVSGGLGYWTATYQWRRDVARLQAALKSDKI